MSSADRQDEILEGTAIWVTCECSPDGVYFPAVVCGDRVHPLDRESATGYALALLAVVEHAVHDAAVANLLVSLDLPAKPVAMAVADIRSERPEVDQEACGPFRFEGIVSASTGLPFVHVLLDGEKIAQWVPQAARGHAAHVAAAPFAADADEALRRTLVGMMSVPDDTARSVIGGLGEFRRDDHDGGPA